jgi:hypothetical protein
MTRNRSTISSIGGGDVSRNASTGIVSGCRLEAMQ